MESDTIKNAVAEEVEINENTPVELLEKLIAKSRDTEYGLPVIEVGKRSYLVAKNEEAANEAVGKYIDDSFWAFCSEFLAEQTGLREIAFKKIQPLCEDGNETVKAIVEHTCGVEAFIEAAIAADGRGRFLSFYDGCEIGIGGYLLYRRD